MDLRLSVAIEGDREMFVRTARTLNNTRPLVEAIGVLGLSSMGRRLATVLKQGDAIRSGRLAASLTMGGAGNVFELSDTEVAVGSNLPYAAQVHFGGFILPKDAKALAIPLDPILQRQGIGPREYAGELRFQPIMGAKPNVMGLLIDDKADAPMYALAYWVNQPARPYAYWDEEDQRVIDEELFPAFLGLDG